MVAIHIFINSFYVLDKKNLFKSKHGLKFNNQDADL